MRTLDAGCGSGAFAIYAAVKGNETVGISFNPDETLKARERANILGISNINFVADDLRNLSQISSHLGEFDQIICFETIEHIMNDDQLIQDLCALLKPGGRLLLTSPYLRHHRLLGERLSEYEDGGHVRWGYTHEQMHSIFQKHQLDVVTYDYVSGVISQTLTNLMRFLSRIDYKVSWVLTFPLRILQLLDKPLTEVMGYPYLCIAVVGVKKSDE